MNTSFFGELLQTIAERGRALLDDRHNFCSIQLCLNAFTRIACFLGSLD